MSDVNPQPTRPLRVLVAIPTYNEADNIGPLVAGVRRHAPQVDLLFVDDNSRDGTQGEIAAAMAEHPGRIDVLHRAGKLGLGTAYVAAFAWALARGYDAVIEMDADLSHRSEDLARIADEITRRPVVVGSRYVRGGGTRNWGVMRRWISQFGSLYARTILRMPTRDMTGGFNAWRRDVLEAIDPAEVQSEGYAFQIELKYRAHLAGFPAYELPILFVERRAGQSKMSGGIVLEGMVRVLGLARQRRALRARARGYKPATAATTAMAGGAEAAAPALAAKGRA
jgi:dolichol-phosphate mannosyltransferase